MLGCIHGTCPHPVKTGATLSDLVIWSHFLPDGVAGITGAGQAAAWAVQALGAQPLLAAWAFVARFTLAGTGGGRTVTPVVAVTAQGALEAKGPEGAFLLAPAGQQSRVSFQLGTGSTRFLDRKSTRLNSSH